MTIAIAGGTVWILLMLYWASGAWSNRRSFWSEIAPQEWPEISRAAVAGGVFLAVTEGCEATITPEAPKRNL